MVRGGPCLDGIKFEGVPLPSRVSKRTREELADKHDISLLCRVTVLV